MLTEREKIFEHGALVQGNLHSSSYHALNLDSPGKVQVTQVSSTTHTHKHKHNVCTPSLVEAITNDTVNLIIVAQTQGPRSC
jgi:hypothetical protein